MTSVFLKCPSCSSGLFYIEMFSKIMHLICKKCLCRFGFQAEPRLFDFLSSWKKNAKPMSMEEFKEDWKDFEKDEVLK